MPQERDRPGEAISEVIGKKKGRRQRIIVGADRICPCAMREENLYFSRPCGYNILSSLY